MVYNKNSKIYFFPIGSGWVWSYENVSCASDIGYNKWTYYDPETNGFEHAGNTLSFTCVSSDCCLECTDFPNDEPPYGGTVYAFDVITENGKSWPCHKFFMCILIQFI